mmetsp:Transcript_45248/g.33023  ORF Transcript_45248/g.33023 Transcript_45248/m.33023 type:complete len:125 (+) Transcript_45248:144-518(+)
MLKKSSKSVFGLSKWQKRYLVLDGDKATFFEDGSKKKAKKVILMSSIKQIAFHYDENAPVKSKKMKAKDNDETRFDVYTQSRKYQLKPESGSIWDSQEWVKLLEQAAKQHSKIFKPLKNESDSD